MDHDRLFKELLTTFFVEFVELFLPEVASYMERDSIEFLDKEIFTDIQSGERREVDLLVKTRFRGYGEGCFLIHVETQSTPQKDFNQRFCRYFSLLHFKYLLPVYPVALFSYDRPLRSEPDRYQVVFPTRLVLDFSFHVIQLNRLNWRDYLRQPNPVASALMTKMQIAPEDRPRVKLECLRMLATLKLDRARATLISAFMDVYLKLNAAESVVYNQELANIEPQEREVVMQLTNEWIESGRADGRVEGRTEGRRELVVRQLRRLIGSIPAHVSDRIGMLNDIQLDQFGEALLDFRNLADAETWLGKA